jgi:hypothetical protein
MTWQVVGLVIAKLGMDQVAFAAVSVNKNSHFEVFLLIKKRSSYLACVISIVGAFFFDIYVAFSLFVSILLDTFSTIRMSELNAREEFIKASTANLLNYPVFFCGIFVSSFLFELSEIYILALFCASSFLRAVWLQLNQIPTLDLVPVESNSDVRMVVQQVLNSLMFRLDQIALSFPAFPQLFLKGHDLGTYLFLAKYFEIAASIVPIIGAVIFPAIWLSFSGDGSNESRSRQKLRALSYGIWLITIVGLFLVYITWLSTAKLRTFGNLPFVLGAFLALPVNLITYSMLRAQRLDRLIRNQVLGLLTGCLLWLGLYLLKAIENLGWLVAFQLFIFAVLSRILDWRRERTAYNRLKCIISCTKPLDKISR